jgi:hypothetical protein
MSREQHVAHRFFVGDNSLTRCQVWGQLLIKKQKAENTKVIESSQNIVGASCVATGIDPEVAPWIEDGTRGLTPGLPGQPSF